MSTNTTAFTLTDGRNGPKVHRTTCKKAMANPAALPMAAEDGNKRIENGQAATCCKPRPVAVPERTATPQDKPLDKVVAKAVATTAERELAEAQPAAVDGLEPEGPARVAAAKREHQALAKATAAERKTMATPNLDALNAANAPGARKAKRERKPRAKVEVKVRFMRGPFADQLKPMPDSQNKLSSVAYYHTRGVTGAYSHDDDVERCTTELLRSILVNDHGVADVEGAPWGPIMLPNGTWLAAEKL